MEEEHTCSTERRACNSKPRSGINQNLLQDPAGATHLPVRWGHVEDVVQPARPEEGGVQSLGSVGGSNHQHLLAADLLKVHLQGDKHSSEPESSWSNQAPGEVSPTCSGP